MKPKKGQSSIEFMVTYGWVILVVLVGLLLLWRLGIFEPRKTTPIQTKISGFSQIIVEDFSISMDNNVYMYLRNDAPANVIIEANSVLLEITGVTCNPGPAYDVHVPAGGHATIGILCAGSTGISDFYEKGEIVKVKVKISYRNVKSGYYHSSVGTLRGPLVLTDMTLTTVMPTTSSTSTTTTTIFIEVTTTTTTTTTLPISTAYRKGPYIIYEDDNTEMTVLWQMNDTPGSAAIEWGTTPAYGNFATVSENGNGVDQHQFEHTLTVIPDQRIYYGVNVDGNIIEDSFLAAPLSSETSVTFYAYGDTRSDPLNHSKVMDAILRDVDDNQDERQTFLLHSGDWVENGNSESQWDEQYFNRSFPGTVELMRRMPVMGTIGNHEWNGGTLVDKYWPYFGIALHSFDYGPVHVTNIYVLDEGSDYYLAGSSEYDALSSDLSSEKEWKVVVVHSPLYSAGGGHPNNLNVQARLQELFEIKGVDVVVAGHNHYYARANVSNIQHITAGGGGAPLRDPDPSYDPVNVVKFDKSYHYVKFNITGDAMTVTAIREDDSIIESFTIDNVVGTEPVAYRKGPYLIYRDDNTKMTALWQTNDTPSSGSTIEWGVDTSYGNGPYAVTESGNGADQHQFEYNLTGLTPGQRIYYRVDVDGNSIEDSFLAAPEASDTSLTFYAYGDTRTFPASHNTVLDAVLSDIDGSPNERQTLLLHSGDWVSSGEIESRWDNQYFDRSYGDTLELMRRMPIMGTVGNHEFVSKNDLNTLMKKYWPYSYESASDWYYSIDYGPVHVSFIDVYHEDWNISKFYCQGYDCSTGDGTDEYDWLYNDLSSTTKPWKVVVLHAPLYSSGHHENYPNPVHDDLQTLFVSEGVDVVVTGHNHYYARAVVDGIQHITAGSGGAPLYATEGGPFVVIDESTINFVRFNITGNAMTITAMRQDGSEIESLDVST